MTGNKDLRLITPLAPEMVAAIDEYRWEYRMPSRISAIRVLLAKALGEEDIPIRSDHEATGRQTVPKRSVNKKT